MVGGACMCVCVRMCTHMNVCVCVCVLLEYVYSGMCVWHELEKGKAGMRWHQGVEAVPFLCIAEGCLR